ncbi:hypothetical protein ACFVR1_09680 [Psychrobacillus sp. NPDC058041]
MSGVIFSTAGAKQLQEALDKALYELRIPIASRKEDKEKNSESINRF